MKYVIYSHHHYDHIAGGKALKDAGATFIAHQRAKERLEVLKDPHTVLPDEAVERQGPHDHARRHDARVDAITGSTIPIQHAGDAAAEGARSSSSSTCMPVGHVPGRGMIDFYPLEAEAFMQAGAGDGLGTHDPRPSRAPGDRLGTKQDVQDQLDAAAGQPRPR